ncbi:MAG: OmpA family protein [Candidatus Omnitrophota bacterium]
MKKVCLLLIVLVGLGSLILPQDRNKIITAYSFEKPSIYRDEIQAISDSDMNCIYIIRDKIKDAAVITGAEVQEYSKTQYSDGDRMFINKGTDQKIRDGQLYLILGEGEKVRDRISGKFLGIYHVRKGIAQVACVYDNKSVITLNRVCHPVDIGDVLIPYEPLKPLYLKKYNFRLCRLPKSPVAGTVVYSNMYMENKRVIASTNEYVTVDIGSADAFRGDWVLLYKIYDANLPPVIIGTGIIVAPEKTNSTVKIIETTLPVTMGTRALLIQGNRPMAKTETGEKKETLPVIEEFAGKTGGEEKNGIELDIQFDFDQATIRDDAKQQMAVISDFINAHPNYDVILRGYCCGIGGEEYNLKLSQLRVENIKQYLVSTFHIVPETIEANYYGEKGAPYDNTAEDQRRKNRLVQINIQIVAH